MRQRDGYLQLVADRGLVPQVVVRGRAAVAVAGQLGQVLPVLVLQNRGQEDDAVGVLLVVVDAFVGQFQRRGVAVQRLHQRVVGGRAALRVADDVPLAVVAAVDVLFFIAVVALRLVLARPRHDVLLVPLVELHRHRFRPREGLHEEAVSPGLVQRVARGNRCIRVIGLRYATVFYEDRHGVGALGFVCRRGERPVAVRHVHLAVRLVRVGNRAAVGSGEGVVPRTLIVVVVVVVQVHVVALRVIVAVAPLVGHAGGLEGQHTIVAPVHRELGHRLFSLKTAQCDVFLVFYPACITLNIVASTIIFPRHLLFHRDALHTVFKCLGRGRVVHTDIIVFYIANPYLSPGMVDSFQGSIGFLQIIFLPLLDQMLGAVGCHQINLSFV